MADTRLTIFQSDATTAAIDYRTEATNGDGRQVIVIGDPSINANVAAVQQTDPASNVQGIVVRDVNTSAIVSRLGTTIFVNLDPGHTLGSISSIGSTVGIYVDATQGTLAVQLKAGTLAVQLDPGHTLGNISSLGSITNTVAVFFSPANPAVAATFAGTAAVYFDQSNPNVKANAGTGTFNVQFDPGHELGSLKGINNSINVHLGSTGGTLGVRVGQIDGSVAVFFSPANPTVNATFSAASLEVVPTTGSRKTMDDAAAAQRVLLVGSQTNASLAISGTLTGITNSINVYLGATAGTLGVRVGQIDGSVAVYFSPANPSVSATFSAASIEVIPTTGSRKITDDAAAALRVLVVGSQTNASLVVSGTVTANAGSGTLTVAFDPGHELGTIKGNSNTLTVFLPDTGHTLGKVDAGVGTFGVNLGKVDGTVQVILDTRSSISGIQSSISVHLLSTAGSLAVKIDPGYNVVNTSSTIIIPITTAGSTAGVSVSGTTIAGPTSSRVLKIYAFSLTTTAQTSLTAKFTNGAGTSPTLYYEMALQAPAQGISGANMAVTPPGYLFATASGGTLSLLLDSASKVHYMVSYFEESA